MRPGAAALVLLLVALALPVRADVVSATREALSLLDDARVRLAGAEGKRDRLRAYGRAIQGYEVALLATRAGLRELAATSARLSEEYQQRKERVEELLTALQMLGQIPRETAVFHPHGALGAARASMILSDLIPDVRAQADELRDRQQKLDTLLALQETTLDDLRRAREELAAARATVLAALEAERRLTSDERDETLRIDTIARNASNMTDLAAGLVGTSVTGQAEILPANEPVKGELIWPVAGRLLRQFNEADAAGIARSGIIIGAAPLSTVRAPVAGKVRYQGDFLDFGQVVVLEPKPGLLFVLAGLGESYVRSGDVVDAGTPIGILGGNEPTDEVFLIGLGDADSAFYEESLYIEVRTEGIAVDPRPWFGPEGVTER